MRIISSLLVGMIAAAIIAALGIAATQNLQRDQLTLASTTLQTNTGWLIVSAAALGFLVALLLLVPGRLASAWRRRSLSRQGQQLQDTVALLREQYAQIQGSHQRLLEERQHLLAQLVPTAVDPGISTPSSLGTAAGMVKAPHNTRPTLPPHQPFPDQEAPTSPRPSGERVPNAAGSMSAS